MSGCRTLPGRRGEAGFTLVEVLVALGLLALLMTAALPAIVGNLQATVVTKSHTQAKNLAQQRLDQMRNLRYHVDRQNGPFLDLLDIYYTNATSASPVTTVTTAGGTLTGRYVATGGGTGGAPAAPFYRVETGPLAGASGFSQVIYSRFLGVDSTPVPTSRFQNLYDTQTVGSDQPPSLMLEVTVVTSWVVGVDAKSYRTQTRITDGRPQEPQIQSQSRAIAVDVTSTAADGTTLALQAGVVSLDGAQSSGSSVAGNVTGAMASRTGAAAVSGKTERFSLPSAGTTSSGAATAQNPGACTWFGFGKTGTANVTADLASGLPNAPANVAAASPPNVMKGYIEHNGGGTCQQLSYNNLVDGGTQRADTIGSLMGVAPFVAIRDTSASGPSIVGSGYVTSNPSTSSPVQTRAGAGASMDQALVLFPNSPETPGEGLVTARLETAQVDCTGTSGAAGTASGSYELVVRWWGRGPSDTSPVWHEATWTYTSSDPAPVLTGDTWDPSGTYLSDGVTTLDELVELSTSSGTPASISPGVDGGVRGFPSGILTLTTAPTLSNEAGAGYSAINARLGQLTCSADDRR